MKKLLTSLLCIAMITVYMPAAVWADDGKTAENLPAAVDGVVTLDKDYEVSNLNPNLTYDLKGHTLTYSGKESIEIGEGQILTFKDSTASPDQIGNGKIVFTQKESLVKGDIHPTTGGTVNAFNIQIESPNSVFFPAGDAAAVNVDSCKVSAGCYCVGTNAGKPENAGVKITLTNSTFVAHNDASDNCPVMINVEGSLKVDNCTITGDRQGVLVRAGEAEINNSTVINTGEYSDDNKYDDDDWGSGNEVPVAAIVVGSHNGKYLDDAIVTVIDTVIESQKDGIPAIYVDANANFSSDLVLTGIKTQVDGEIVKKNQQKADITITGGTFSDTSAKAYVPEGMDTYGRANGKFTVAEKTPQGQIPDIDPTPGYEWVQDENGNYVEQKIPTPPATVQKPEIIVDDGAKAELSSLGTTAAITVEEGYELVDVTLNGVSLGKVTTVTGLKTGDKLVITTQKKLTDEEKDLIEAVESAAIDASTVLGDGYIRVNWTTAGTTEMDYYEIYRSTERDGDYGDTPYFTTKHGRLSGWYKNTKELEKGTCYYYKVRGVKEINGEKYSTPWSDIGYRTYKEIGKGVRNTTIKAWSSAGKGYIRVQWRKSAGYRVDYYEVYRTAKRGSWEDAAYFKTKEGGMSGWYKNTKELKKGTRYYYKVRGVKELDGKKVYTRWSTLAYRIAQ